jgi:hypothetical protein
MHGAQARTAPALKPWVGFRSGRITEVVSRDFRANISAKMTSLIPSRTIAPRRPAARTALIFATFSSGSSPA